MIASVNDSPPSLDTNTKSELVRTRVTEIDETGVFAGESRIEARTVLWAAGVQASPLGAMLAASTGVKLDRAGRVVEGVHGQRAFFRGERMLVRARRIAGEVVRALAWMGPSECPEALRTLSTRLPAAQLQEAASARGRLPTWLAKGLSSWAGSHA